MTNKNEILYQYKNEEKPFPYFPESLNIKIADYCNVKHEFIYADLNKLRAILISLPAGVELNIEGDTSLKHPDLIEFLVWCQSRGLVCNLIIRHLFIKEHRAIIDTLVEENLVINIILPTNENSIFSMYIDAVNQEYAPTSISNDRVSFNEMSLFEYFIKELKWKR